MAKVQKVNSLDRGLTILEYLSDANEPKSLKVISTTLNIPSTSTFRILKNMVDRGYVVEQNIGVLVYTIGQRIAELAYHFYKNISLNAVALPIMKNLSNLTNQTSQLAIMNGNKFTYVEQVFPPTPVNVIAPLHTPISINFSAGAKIILANKPIEFQRDFLDNSDLERRTPNTIIDKKKLLKELELAKNNGYALDNEEFSQGVGCIAIPIFNYNLECISAVGITGQINNYKTPDQFNFLLESVKNAGREISRIFGHQD